MRRWSQTERTILDIRPKPSVWRRIGIRMVRAAFELVVVYVMYWALTLPEKWAMLAAVAVVFAWRLDRFILEELP